MPVGPASVHLRATDGLWTPAINNWFETGDSITVSAPGSVPMPAAIPGMDEVTNFSATTTCTHPTGCALRLTGESDTAAMATPDNGDHIPHVALGAPVPWAPGDDLGMGFTVLGSDSGKDTGVWGTGTDFTDLNTLHFTGAGRAPVDLHRSSGPGAETTSIGVRWNPPSGTLAGDYETRIRLIAVPAP